MTLYGMRKLFAPVLVMAILISAGKPMPGQAEAFGPSLTHEFLVGEGGFVIANYTGPFFVVWDLRRIWDRLQPTQVLVYHGSGEDFSYDMPLAVSQDEQRLAFQDRDTDNVYLCDMGAPFICRLALDLDRELIALELSPRGDQLLLVDQAQIRLYSSKDNTVLSQKSPTKSSACQSVDWEAGITALGSLDGGVHLVSLKDLKELRKFQHAAANECRLYFTGDGQRLISTWERDAFDENSKYYVEREIWNDPVSAPAVTSRSLKGNARIVPGDQQGELWIARYQPSGAWTIAPLDPAGEPLKEDTFEIVTGPYATPLALSQKGKVVLVNVDENLLVYDLQSHLPLAWLYHSKVGYWSDGKTLLHRTPGLGADPAYDLLEVLALSYHLDRSLDQFSDQATDFRENRLNVLLWTAALATKRGDRYDRVWFDLLPIYRQDTRAKMIYQQLTTLCRLMVQLYRAESLQAAGYYSEAFNTSREALISLRSSTELSGQPGDVDIHQIVIPDLILRYARVIQRELWLVMGESLAYQGHFPEAAQAFRGALESDPDEWRAYDGILRAFLGAEERRWQPVFDEAQAALRLEDWQNGPRADFFWESEIQKLRDSDSTFPGSSLNYK